MGDAPGGQIRQQFLRRAAIGRLSRRQAERERAALSVGDGVELGAAAASTDTDRLGVSPIFPPAAERCAFTCVLSISTSAGGPPSAASTSNSARHTPFPDQRLCRLYSVLWKPWVAGAPFQRHPDCSTCTISADHPPIIDTRCSARPVRQQRLKSTPLPVIQPPPPIPQTLDQPGA